MFIVYLHKVGKEGIDYPEIRNIPLVEDFPRVPFYGNAGIVGSVPSISASG